MDFFDLIAPSVGVQQLVAMRKGAGVHRRKWINAREDRNSIESFVVANEGYDLYFTPASFYWQGAETERKLSNVNRVRSIWLDIDAGIHKLETKATTYVSYIEAIQALDKWLESVDMYDPTFIVHSGVGIQVYWVFDSDIDQATARGLANELVSSARSCGMSVDSAPSVNTVGLLRIPGSLHTSSGNIATILFKGDVVSVEDLSKVLNYTADVMPSYVNQQEDDTWDSLTKNDATFSFDRIVKSGVCGQIEFAIHRPTEVSEPLWHSILSVAKNCEDGVEWAHRISALDEYRYNPSDVDRKLHRDMPPTGCSKFDDVNPGICGSCPLAGKIKCPISLGRIKNTEVTEVEVAPPEEVFTVDKEEPPEIVLTGALESLDVEATAVEAVSNGVNLPPSFWYDDHGYIRYASEGVASTDDMRVLDKPTRFLGRVYDPLETGEMVLVEAIVGPEHARETRRFKIPFTEFLIDPREYFFKYGVQTTKESIVLFKAVARDLMDNHKYISFQRSYGWSGDRQVFAHGDTIFYKDWVKPPEITSGDQLSDAALQMRESLTPNKLASLEVSKKAFEMFGTVNNPGAHYIFGLSLISPLYGFLKKPCGMVHLYTDHSGVGKTTSAKVAASIWGNPEHSDNGSGLTGISSDTDVATFIKMSVLSCFPYIIDEITKWDPDRLHNVVYAATQGRDKDRGRASDNSLRTNTGSWYMPVFSTGNCSAISQLATQGEMAEGLTARVLELDFSNNESLFKHYSRQEVESVIDNACDNYGIMGRHFLLYMLNKMDHIIDRFNYYRDLGYNYFGFSQGDRYLSNMVAGGLLGIEVGNTLGFWRYDIENVMKYLHANISDNRAEVQAMNADAMSLIEAFTQENYGCINVIGSNGYSISTTIKRVVGMYQQGTGELALSEREFRRWVESNHLSYRKIKKELLDRGAKSTRRAILSGLDISTLESTERDKRPQVLVLKTTNPQLVNALESKEHDADNSRKYH